MVDLTPLMAKSFAISIIGIMWPGAVRGKKKMWSLELVRSAPLISAAAPAIVTDDLVVDAVYDRYLYHIYEEVLRGEDVRWRIFQGDAGILARSALAGGLSVNFKSTLSD